MKQRNIDNFFKNKLEHREVKFNEHAWAAAEQLIIDQERKRFWKRFSWLLLLVPLLIGAAFIFVIKPNQLNSPASQNSISPIQDLSNMEEQNEVTLSIGNTSVNEEEKNSDDQMFSNAASVNHQNKEETLGSSEDHQSIPSLKPLPSDINNNHKRETNPAFVEPPNLHLKREIPNNKSNTTEKRKLNLPQALSLPNDNENNNNLHIPEKVNNIKPSIRDTGNGRNELSENFAEKSNMAQLDIPNLDYHIDEATPKPNKEQLKKYKSKKLAWGVMSSAMISPNFNGRVIDFSGANAGLTFGWAPHRRWSFNADVLYEFHRRNVSFPNGNNTLFASYDNYSFGLEERNLEVTLKQTHLLTLPVYLQFHMRKHQLEAGVQIAYIFGLKGDLSEEINSTLDNSVEANTRENVQKNTWLDVNGVNPFEFNLMAGYRFKLTDKLNIGLRVLVIPNGKSSKDDATSFEDGAYDPINDPGINVATNTYSIGESYNDTSIPLLRNNTFNFQFNVQYSLNKKSSYSFKPLLEL